MLFQILEMEEGFSPIPYYCSEGYPTIGIGKRIGPKGADLSLYDFTVSLSVADVWLAEDVTELEVSMRKYGWFKSLNADRQAIILSMCYQMGISGTLKFKKMIHWLSKGQWKLASKEALDSKWARQTPNRARRHARVILHGDVTKEYEL